MLRMEKCGHGEHANIMTLKVPSEFLRKVLGKVVDMQSIHTDPCFHVFVSTLFTWSMLLPVLKLVPGTCLKGPRKVQGSALQKR